MTTSWFPSLMGVLLISLFSLVGVFFVALEKEKLERMLLFLVSFAAGGLLGDVFFHLLPEIVNQSGFGLQASLGILTGLLAFFVLEKFIHWRHCHLLTSSHHPHPLVWTNLLGDGLHNLIDGMIIAASFLTGFGVGVATCLAVVLHEIPQEIGDFSILLHAGLRREKALVFNFLSSLLAVMGAVLVLALGSKTSFLSWLTPLTTGGFLYIAGVDLIPELHKETGLVRSLFQMLGLILGLGVMLILR